MSPALINLKHSALQASLSLNTSNSEPILNNIREIRLNKGLCLNQVARAMDTEDFARLHIEEDPHADLLLSDLYKWAHALGVDVTELLQDEEESNDCVFQAMNNQRTCRNLMKNIVRIFDESKDEVQAYALRCIDILLDVDPELFMFVSDHYRDTQVGRVFAPAAPRYRSPYAPTKLPHRLREARIESGIALRAMSRRLFGETQQGKNAYAVRAMENGQIDLCISVLRTWADELSVPIEILIHDNDDSLTSKVIAARSKVILLMKTVESMLEAIDYTSSSFPRAMILSLRQQILAIMPELNGLSTWSLFGQKRASDDLGIAAERCVSEELLSSLELDYE